MSVNKAANTKKANAAVLGVGAAACAACCAGPILGFLAAIGLGTAAGFALFGAAAIAVGAIATVIVVRRRRRRAASCAATIGPVSVEMIGSTYNGTPAVTGLPPVPTQ